MILLAGRYEGIDERLIEGEVDEELSLGDFVLSGGEIAAMAVIDAVVRLLPGVLGDDESAVQDSFMEGLLDHPHYTRPESIDGQQSAGSAAVGRSCANSALALQAGVGTQLSAAPGPGEEIEIGAMSSKSCLMSF